MTRPSDSQDGLVSIGLPVFNGENHLRRAIDSLLSQDYEKLELIISDNASTDRTPEICREYVKKDKRVQYVQQTSNRGASWNFRNVFDLSSGQYFMWAGHHDLWRRDFVRSCKEVLDAEPQVVLCYTEIHRIDGDGNIVEVGVEHHDTRGLSTAKRVREIVGTLTNCDMFYGLFRASVLKQCHLDRTCIGPDHVILMEVSLYGSIAELKKPGFLSSAGQYAQSRYVRIGQRLMKLDPKAAHRKRIRPFWDLGFEHLRAVYSSRLPPLKKFYLFWVVVYSYWGRYPILLLRELFNPAYKKGVGVELNSPRS